MNKITIKQGEYTLDEIKKMFEENRIFKYPNGAVVEALENKQPYFYIGDVWDGFGSYYTNSKIDKCRLLTRNVFLTREEAEKEFHRKARYYGIIKEIDKINREENWVCDWNDSGQAKWYLYYNYMKDSLHNYFRGEKAYICRQNDTYMCKKAIDWVITLPDGDKKILIGIYD
jgi:hypothetical protein